MANQVIGVGTVANDGTGDPLRTAFIKCNANFLDLYGGGSFVGSIAVPAGFGYTINGVIVVKADTVARNWFFGGGAGGNNATTSASGGFNTGIGDSSLASLTTGTNNTGLGFGALFADTSGGSNVAIGFEAMFNHTTGSNNVAIGNGPMSASLSCQGNIAIGQQALNSLTANDGFAGSHLAIGTQAMQNYNDSSGTGLRNTAVGHDSLQELVSGGNNTGCGFESLLFLGRHDGSQNVSDNTGLGSLAGCYNTDGADSTFVGAFAGFGNARADSPGFGSNAMLQCTFVGSKAGIAVGNVTGGTLVGYQAGADLTDGGNENTFVGANTGRGVTTGSQNTVIGAGVTGLSATLANKVIIADGAGNVVLDTRPYTVATLPAASSALKGARAFVTDASSPTFLGTLSGSSTTVCPVFCNGAAWVAG